MYVLCSERIYFVQEGFDGAIKIGIGSDIPARLRSLQCGNPRRLNLVGSFDGPRGTEHWLHRRLHRYRVFGEWYEPADAVFQMLDKCETYFSREAA